MQICTMVGLKSSLLKAWIFVEMDPNSGDLAYLAASNSAMYVNRIHTILYLQEIPARKINVSISNAVKQFVYE